MDKKPLKIRTLTDGRDMKTDDYKKERDLVCCSCCDGTGKVLDETQDLTDGTPDLTFKVEKRDDGVYTTLTTYFIEDYKVENASIEHTLKDVKDYLKRQISYVCVDLLEVNDEDILLQVVINNNSITRHRRINRQNGDVNINIGDDINTFMDDKFNLLNNSTFDKLYRQSK